MSVELGRRMSLFTVTSHRIEEKKGSVFSASLRRTENGRNYGV